MIRTPLGIVSLVAAAALAVAGAALAQPCIDEDPVVHPDPGTFEHRWAGQVNRLFSLDGEEAWTAEDGGRIRHRRGAGLGWEFQRTPFEVREQLRGIFFLDAETGWCVGQGGWVLATTDGGAVWDAIARIPEAEHGYDDLYDVRFTTPADGWIAGLHGIYYTHDGGGCWSKAELYDHLGNRIDGSQGFEIEPYALDIVVDHPLAPAPFFGLASAEPGYVFRTVDGHTWTTAFFLPTSSLCGQIQTPCNADACDIEAEFEPWKIEISRNATEPLTLVAGGYGVGCGVILASADFGDTWVQELHECQVQGANCPPPSGVLGPLDSPRTYYGLAIFDADNTAIASGYNGQHIRRPAGPPGTPWIDESRFANSPHPDHAYVPGQDLNGSIFPLYAAWADEGAFGSGRAFVTGVGGQIRASADGGDSWLPETDGTFHRVSDATFTDDLTGYQVGQLYRIGRTTDGGLTWAPVVGFQIQKAGFFGIDSGDDGTIVAVGGVTAGAGVPNLLRSADGLSWQVMGTGDVTLPAGYALAPLRDVAVTGAGVAWAVGDNGLVLRSTNGGLAWEGFLLPDPTVDIEGLAFTQPRRGIVVGRVPGGGGSTARVYAVLGNSAVPTFSPLTIPSGVVTLVDAATNGSAVYAVGKIADPVERGVVLRWNGSQFEEIPGAPAFPPCLVGASPTSRENGILDALAFAPESGDLWIGGECGVVWQYTPASGTWTEHKSQSSAHVLAIDFPPDPDPGVVGYFSTFRQTEPHPVLVRTGAPPPPVAVETAEVHGFELAPVQPNPSGAAIRLRWRIPAEARVRIDVHDVQGRRVASLLDRVHPAGAGEVAWNGGTALGPARSGVYLARLRAGGVQLVRRFVLSR